MRTLLNVLKAKNVKCHKATFLPLLNINHCRRLLMSTNTKETAENIKATASMAAAPITNAFAATAIQSASKGLAENKMRLESSVISNWKKSFVTQYPNDAIIKDIDFKYEFECLKIMIRISNLALKKQNKTPPPLNWCDGLGISAGGDSWNSKLEKHGGYEDTILSWGILCPGHCIAKSSPMGTAFSLVSKYFEAIDTSVIDEVVKMFPVVDDAIYKENVARIYRSY